LAHNRTIYCIICGPPAYWVRKVAVTGPSKRRFIGHILRPGELPENVELIVDEQYIVLGWDDITADLSAGKAVGANAPTWSTYRDGIGAYAFDAGTMNEIFVVFHVKHDYADGTKVYPHVHWGPNTTSTGVVRWGFEYTLQKGHDQGAFPASTTIYIEYDVTVDKQYQHIISEVVDANAFDAFEADTLILMRIFRDAGHANDTFPDDVFAFTADVHFQVDKQATPNRSPPFTAR